MARPAKVGLDYFPLDVYMDDKVELIEAKYGIQGFGIVIKLFQKIYSEGYYYSWTEKEILLFSKKINVDINSINDVINDCIKWELFNKEIYEKHKVLTSRGIQKRYIEAIKRRKDSINEYNLINVNNNEINVNNNSVNADNVHTESTQSKVNESKVNENKNICVNPTHAEKSQDDGAQLKPTGKGKEYTQEFEKFWEIYPKKLEKKGAFSKWNIQIRKGVTSEHLIKAADNYATYCKNNNIEQQFIKNPTTFLGPQEPFMEWINKVPIVNKPVQSKGKTNKFINFEQPTWDYDQLESLEMEYMQKKLKEDGTDEARKRMEEIMSRQK